jgi:hypothetical protein
MELFLAARIYACKACSLGFLCWVRVAVTPGTSAQYAATALYVEYVTLEKVPWAQPQLQGPR